MMSRTTRSIDTQTSPADIRLSHVDASQLRLWATAFAPDRWIALPITQRRRRDTEEENVRGSDGSAPSSSDAEGGAELSFVRVNRRCVL